jgi:hypothetical protein
MLDQTKFTHISTKHSNVFIVVDPKQYDSSRAMSICPKVQPFIDAAAVKFPQWNFYSMPNKRYKEDAHVYEAEKFVVYQGREELGEISTAWSRGDYKFYIDNPRIDEMRERGRGMSTSDLNKALKSMGKMFGVKTIKERMADMIGKARHGTDNVARNAMWKYEENYRHMVNYLREHIQVNMEPLINVAIAAGGNKEQLLALPSEEIKIKVTKEIAECNERGRGATVLIHGKDYAVSEVVNGERVMAMFSTDTLPAHLKAGVGMLKLVETGDCVSGVGYRVDDSAFYLIKGTQE